MNAHVLLDKAVSSGLLPTVVTWDSVLHSCQEPHLWASAGCLLQRMATAATEPTIVTFNTAMPMTSPSAGSASWSASAMALAKLSSRSVQADLLTYSACMGILSAEAWSLAAVLLCCVHNLSLQVDSVLLASSLKLWTTASEWQLCLTRFDVPEVLQPRLHPAAANSFLSGASQNGQDWNVVLESLQQLAERGLRVDTVSWGSVLGACVGGLSWATAASCLDLPRAGVQLDAPAAAEAVAACARASRWRLGAAAVRQRCSVSDIGRSVLGKRLTGELVKVKLWQASLGTLKALATGGLEAHVRDQEEEGAAGGSSAAEQSPLLLLSAAEGAALRWENVLQLFTASHWPQSAWPSDSFLAQQAAAVAACSKGQAWNAAVRLLLRPLSSCWPMRSLLPEVQSTAFNSCLSALEKGDHWEAGLGLLTNMFASRVEATIVALDSCITACGDVGWWRTSLRLLSQGRHVDLQLCTITYNAAMTSVGRSSAGAETWIEILEVFRGMSSERLEPSEVSLGVLTGSLANSAQWRQVSHIQEALSSWHQDGWADNAIILNGALLACSAAGKWPVCLELAGPAGLQVLGKSPRTLSTKSQQVSGQVKIADAEAMSYGLLLMETEQRGLDAAIDDLFDGFAT
eukprot:TRINITY_DN36290_c0_g1_i1.p1 TRINITY_DN36290_c0_g1~~TRINITY_DN36290_c0_g1_i1.p1  ORF type:complete len:631 (+),score=79.13 TRINITY_DN36290_c0_g1_i1:756-2648(+)